MWIDDLKQVFICRFMADGGCEPLDQFCHLGPDQMRAHPHGLFGSVDEICDELERRREAYGISYVTVGGDNREAFAPVVARLAGR